VSHAPRSSNRQAGGFQPPHCPNPDCEFHHPRPDWHFVFLGHKQRRKGSVQYWKCRHCNRQFCAATFSSTYWLRRKRLLIQCAKLVTEGCCYRQAARVLGVSHSTVARHVARLGRHALLFHVRISKDLVLREPLVIDGFESFTRSQYFPFHINLAAGDESWFISHFTHASLRRKGRMTEKQKKRRIELELRHGRPDPKAIERSVTALVKEVVRRSLVGRALTLHSDDHPAYVRALNQLRLELADCPEIKHHVTSSKKRRTQSNPLFSVNLDDLLLRHGSANHRRETIAFSKELWSALYRAGVFLVWRNYVKHQLENAPSEGTCAMRVGLCDRPLKWGDVLRRRLFPAHIELPEMWTDYYWGRVTTLPNESSGPLHVRKYAF